MAARRHSAAGDLHGLRTMDGGDNLPPILSLSDRLRVAASGGLNAYMFMPNDEMSTSTNDLFVDPSLASAPRSHDHYVPEQRSGEYSSFSYSQSSSEELFPIDPRKQYVGHWSTLADTSKSTLCGASMATPVPFHSSSSTAYSLASVDLQTPRNDNILKGRCPLPACGRIFKDIKAHMLTHQADRPEKCPVVTCEYQLKGFARKYDANRHTLTHYKGSMVCGFCPGSGSPAEKRFSRADVFKRHLTSVHGVEQTPPNSRKRSPGSHVRDLSSYCADATGKCSLCRCIFNDAQDFSEHLDDCVLHIVRKQQSKHEDIRQDQQTGGEYDVPRQDEMRDNMVHYALDNYRSEVVPSPVRSEPRSEEGAGKGHRQGVRQLRDLKQRKQLPPSWRSAPEKVKMKKRVVFVNDGKRSLCNDDPLLHNSFEVPPKPPHVDDVVLDFGLQASKRDDPNQSTDQANLALSEQFTLPQPDSHHGYSGRDTSGMAKHSDDNMPQDNWPITETCDSNVAAEEPALASNGLMANSMSRSSSQQSLIQQFTTPPERSTVPDYMPPLSSGSLSTAKTLRYSEKDAPAPSCFTLLPSIADILQGQSCAAAYPPVLKHRQQENTTSVLDEGNDGVVSPCAPSSKGKLEHGEPHTKRAQQPTPSSATTSEDEPCNRYVPIPSPKSKSISSTESWSSEDCQPQSGSEDLIFSEGELSFIATPPADDSQYRIEAPTSSQRLAFMDSVAQRIAKQYTAFLLRTRGGQGQSSEFHGSSTLGRNLIRESKPSKSTLGKRCNGKKRGSTDEQSDEEGDEGSRKRPSINGEREAATDGKLLACPYAKFDPTRYSELNATEMQYRGCSSCFLTTIPRLKQHLYRVHSRPKHYCSCCFESFNTATLLAEHARARLCNVSPERFDEKMTVDQMTEIKRRTPREERTKSWFAIFQILFPEADLPSTPFVGKYSEECIQDFLGYFQREGPRVLADTVASELNASSLLLDREQRSVLDDVLETALGRVVEVLTQAARGTPRQQRSHVSTNQTSSPSSSDNLREDSLPSDHSTKANASLLPQVTDNEHRVTPDDKDDEKLEKLDSWQMVRTRSTEQIGSQVIDIPMSISNTNEDLSMMYIQPASGDSNVDHVLASQEWQRLLIGRVPSAGWHNSDLYWTGDPFVEVQPDMSWFG